MAISVQVGKFPGRLTPITCDAGSTVADALRHAGLVKGNYDLKIGGESANLDTEVFDGDLVLLTEPIKGNQISVQVGKFPGRLTPVAVDHGDTVADVLRHAGLVKGNYDLKIGGDPATLETEVQDGDLVLLTEPIKGNQISVQVGKFPGRLTPVAVDHGDTVADVLRHAGLVKGNYDLKIGGDPATLDTEVQDGDLVLLTEPIKGNK
jgi:sulfur carrier protein ThiS